VEVAADAIRSLQDSDGQRVLGEFVAAGGTLTSVHDLLAA
jgi:hypothetical protein